MRPIGDGRAGDGPGRGVEGGRATLRPVQSPPESDWPGAERRAEKHTFAAQLLLPHRTQRALAYEVAAELWSSHTGVATTQYELVPRALARKDVARALTARLWETYVARGLVPASWADDPLRGFVRGDVRVDARSKLERLFDPASCEARPGFLDAVILAADPRGVVAAEALARQVVVALGPWGAPAPTRVVWRFTEIDATQRVRSHESFPGGQWASFCATHSLGGRRGMSPEQERLRASIVGDDRADALRWEGAAVVDFVHWRRWVAASQLGLRVSVPERVTEPCVRALEGRAFAELPDPFTPLVDLWWRGYGLEAVGSEAVVLLAARAPAVERPGAAEAGTARAALR